MKRVLIVDDQAENRYLLRTLLEGHGYAVIEARHGAEALAQAHRTAPDVVVSDLLMPTMDGYTLLRQWRADETLGGIPFVVYTATYTDARDERLALELGADAFLRKPAEPEVVLGCVHRMLARQPRETPPSPPGPATEPLEPLAAYNAALIRKLEDKMRQLEESHRNLQIEMAERVEAERALRVSEEQLRALTARLETLREEERTRIAREIHDELGQLLTGLKLDLRWVEHQLDEPGTEGRLNPILDKLVSMEELVDATVQTVQRIAAELRPGTLDRLGLGMALEYETARFQDRTGLTCRVILPPAEPDLSAPAATAFFRIFQEALTNVARHARATTVEVELRPHSAGCELEIRDDGRGLASDDRSRPTSLGLLGMQERARILGGQVRFTDRPGGGTVVTVRLPSAGAATP